MRIHNDKRVRDFEVKEWLIDNIKEITPYQKECLDEAIESAPFDFYKRRERVSSIFWRLSILVYPFVYIGVLLSLPINFLITGRWGYNNIGWLSQWITNIGL